MVSDSTVVLALMRSPGMGNVSVNRLVAWVGETNRSLGDLSGNSSRELLEVLPQGMEHCAEPISSLSGGPLSRAADVIERTVQAGGQAVLASAGDYPDALRLSLGVAAPPLIFVLGDLDALQEPCASVVGTRNPSDAGVSMARDCARVFAETGIDVMSGGARGIDLAAHQSALERGGRTVVVLPQGLLTYRGPQELREGVDAGRVVLFSEFVPDVGFSKHAAITRNTTIAALSRLVCVIEPGATGGSIRTARQALSLGRRVLVHGSPEVGRTEEELVRSGALRLVEEGAGFDGARILEVWADAPDLQADQAELF